MKSIIYEAPHYTVFCILLSAVLSLDSTYSPQHTVPKHPQSMFFPKYERLRD